VLTDSLVRQSRRVAAAGALATRAHQHGGGAARARRHSGSRLQSTADTFDWDAWAADDQPAQRQQHAPRLPLPGAAARPRAASAGRARAPAGTKRAGRGAVAAHASAALRAQAPALARSSVYRSR
jgi:hypothetical protein